MTLEKPEDYLKGKDEIENRKEFREFLNVLIEI